MAAEVSLPMVGGVPKKALVIGGAGAAVLIAVIYMKKKKGAAGPADTSGVVGTDANGNPVYGDTTSDYVSPGLQDTTQGPTYGASGYYDPNSGQWVFGRTGTGQAQATTNAQWAQQAISYLAQTSGADTSALTSALGAYLAGRAVTKDQEALIDQAIAVEGWPPVTGNGGYPPGIRTSAPTPTPTPTPTPGGSGSFAFPAPAGLRASGISATGYRLSWHPVTGPKGQHPSSYTVATYNSKGQRVDQFTVTGTSAAEYGQGGKGLPKGMYHTNVWANGGTKAPAHATVTVSVSK